MPKKYTLESNETNQHILTIVVDFKDFTDSEWKSLVSALQEIDTVHTLKMLISSHDIRMSDFLKIPAIQNITNLTLMSRGHYFYSDHHFLALGMIFKNAENNELSRTFHLLMSLLESNAKSLLSLSLNEQRLHELTIPAIISLQNTLQKLEKLEELVLDDCGLGKLKKPSNTSTENRRHAFISLFDSSILPCLKNLVLSNNQLYHWRKRDFEQLMEKMRFLSLKEINFSGNNLFSKKFHTTFFCGLIRRHRHLSVVDFSKNQFSSRCFSNEIENELKNSTHISRKGNPDWIKSVQNSIRILPLGALLCLDDCLWINKGLQTHYFLWGNKKLDSYECVSEEINELNQQYIEFIAMLLFLFSLQGADLRIDYRKLESKQAFISVFQKEQHHDDLKFTKTQKNNQLKRIPTALPNELIRIILNYIFDKNMGQSLVIKNLDQFEQARVGNNFFLKTVRRSSHSSETSAILLKESRLSCTP